MTLPCPHCQQEIPASAVLEELAVAKCPSCHTIVELPQGGAAVARGKVAMPEKFVVEEFGSTLSVTWRWYSFVSWILLAFCALWDGVIATAYSSMFARHASLPELLFPLIHATAGVGLTYVMVCTFVNSTRVSCEGGLLTVKHGPLPIRFKVELATAEVSQLFSTEKITRNKNGSEMRSYELKALTRGGKKVVLLNGLDDPRQALWLEQRLEKLLRITDVDVEGELPRTTG